LFSKGLPLVLAIVLAIVTVAILAGLFERTAIHPARRASVLTLIIITIGASTAIRGVALVLWGTDPYPLPPFSAGNSTFLGEATILPQSLWVIGISILVVILLFSFFERTLLGKAVRACALNRLAASLTGISPQLMSLFIFMLSGALGAIAGIVIAPITTATYDMGLMLGLKGFVAAALGGMNSTTGAVVGGFVLGILEAMAAGLISSSYKDALAFFVLIVVLIWMPRGIWNRTKTSRV